MKKHTIESRAMRSANKVLPYSTDTMQVYGWTVESQQTMRRGWYRRGYVAGVQSERRRARTI